MNDAPILSDDDPLSMPSMPTMRGGDPNTLGRIDHYDLLRKLGGGGFGVVYLARDTASGVEVAIKTLHPLLKRNAEEMDLLREKFALVSRLAHPNIATALVLHPVRDIHVWDDAARAELKLSPGDSVMVMRYAPGVTLSKWRRQFPDGVVPPDLALEIGRQVAAALDYAHGERIVHRDIKPSNVMVETVAAEPRPLDHGQGAARRSDAPHDSVVCSVVDKNQIRTRILDFGLAVEIRSSMSRVSTEQGDTSGTRPYMAPEQWLGKKQDGRTDQYALACVLYELFSGTPPFAGVFETDDPMIMKSAVVGDAPDEIEDAAPAVNAALLRALAKAPKERFPSCTAFLAALTSTPEHTEGRDGSTSRPPSASGRARSTRAPQDSAALEADVLRRKVALARALTGVSAEDRAHALFGPPAKEAETELAATEEAFKWNRFAAAAACLDRAEAALARLQQARREEEERLRREKEEVARRLSREQAERERKAREEAERLAREQAERERKAREDAERRKAAAERIRRERLDAERLTAERRRRRSVLLGRRFYAVACVAGAASAVFAALRDISDGRTVFGRTMREPHRAAVVEQLVRNMVAIPGKDYSMGKYEVTQEEWEAVMGSTPSYFKNRPSNPVETVSWNDCQEFVRNLNALPAAKASRLVFRLPTTEEWDMACLAGATGDYCKLADGTEITEETLGEVAWFDDNSGHKTHPVGRKKPNAFGLYDMHGNVGEWTQSAVGDDRVNRGGSFGGSAILCSACLRGWRDPGHRLGFLGLRLAASGRADGR